MANQTHAPKRIILTGTSPLMLCRAIGLARAGHHVTMIDRNTVCGGAWQAISAFGHDNIEPAVHLLENRKSAYQGLQKAAGIELKRERGGIGRIGPLRLPLGVVRPICFAGTTTRSMLRRNLDRTTFHARAFMRSTANMATSFRYPLNGAGGMIRQMTGIAREHGVSIMLDTHLKCAEINTSEKPNSCRTSDETLEFDHIGISSRAHCPIRIDGEPFDFPTRTDDTWSLLLHLQGKARLLHSYMEVVADKHIRRVRNVGEFARPQPKSDHHVICVQLRQPPSTVASELGPGILHRLIRMRLLEKGLKCIDAQLAPYRYLTIPDRELSLISRKLAPHVIPVKTTDLAEELANHLKTGDDAMSNCPTADSEQAIA